MRGSLQAGLLMIAATSMSVGNGFSESASDSIAARIAKAAKLGDTPAVIRASRDAEDLWPDSPEGYFQVIRQAKEVLASTLDNSASEECLSNLFVSVSEKKKPGSSAQQDTGYFDQKGKTYLSFLELEKTRNDKSRLLAIALFVGEIRRNMIPNYENRGTSRPGLEILDQAGVSDARSLTEPAQIEAYEKAVKANVENLIMNELQSTLRRYDRIMTFHLLHSCALVSGADSDTTKFISSIVKNARLSENEAKRLVVSGN